MAWKNGGIGSQIPKAVKKTVRARQLNQCATISPATCTGIVEEFDHIFSVKAQRIDRVHANDPDLIQGLCIACHKVKTQGEATAARNRGKRPPPRHPSDT